MLLYFVTPAFQRYELTEICLRQRRLVCDDLRQHGIEATCVVVADDANLEIARSLGFDAIERDNEWLGRRFNDGYEHAAGEGADYVFAIGSDMWCLPSMFYDLPLPPHVWHVHRQYSVVHRNGDRRADLVIADHMGCLRTMPTETLVRCGYRPCDDEIPRGCDTATWNNTRGDRMVAEHACVPFEMVGFQSHDVQITSYDKLLHRFGSETADPFTELCEMYPSALVGEVEEYYNGGAKGLAA